jgi:2-oxoisovalerate dehydrogenase E1 component alpha subunit
VKTAADRGRNGEGPTLIETVSYRLTPHSSDDDDRTYREREEVDEAKKKDSIVTFAQYLRDTGVLTDEKEKEMNDEISEIVNEATDYAENAAYAEAESAMKYVYEE